MLDGLLFYTSTWNTTFFVRIYSKHMLIICFTETLRPLKLRLSGRSFNLCLQMRAVSMWFTGRPLIIQSEAETALQAHSCSNKIHLHWLQLKPEAIYIWSLAELLPARLSRCFTLEKNNMLDFIAALLWVSHTIHSICYTPALHLK